jgi:uncharacterized membrane protein YbhN (UPF0104 family)
LKNVKKINTRKITIFSLLPSSLFLNPLLSPSILFSLLLLLSLGNCSFIDCPSLLPHDSILSLSDTIFPSVFVSTVWKERKRKKRKRKMKKRRKKKERRRMKKNNEIM